MRFNKYILFLILLLHSCFLFSQQFTNSWINFQQQYYRLSISESGVYRVTRAELEASGVPTSSFDSQNIQLFYKGTEIPCYINVNAQGQLNYVEFYVEKNNGWFDVEMYDKPENQTNVNYSLITDNAAVFFTWNTRFDNKRYVVETAADFTTYAPVSYALLNSYEEYTNSYKKGNNSCEYNEAEGWFDNQSVSLGNSLTKKIQTPVVYSTSSLATIDLAIVTYSSNEHHIKITGPGFVLDTIFNGLKTIKYQAKVAASILGSNNSFVFSSIDDISASTDYSAVSYINIKYPSLFDFGSSVQQLFLLPPSVSSKSYIEINNFNASGNVLLYDLSHGLKINAVTQGGVTKALIPPSGDYTNIFITSENNIKSASISKFSPVNHSGKNKPYVIISHPNLWEEAQNYALYRDAYLVNVEELYNQFAYGIEKHPLAIRKFAEYILSNWTVKPKYLFLLGKGINAVNTRKNNANFDNSYIPPLGEPASDVLLTANILDNSGVSAIATGRLSASINNNISDYLNKVKEFESNAPAEWMKRLIHFGGGQGVYEQNSFRNYLKAYENTIADSLFGGSVSTFLKKSSNPIAISRTDSVTGLINGGISLLTFFGHGSTNGFDQNIDEPENYKNQGKYPLLLSNSCYSGNIHLPGNPSMSEEWVLIPNRGSIGFLAFVNEGNPYYLNLFSSKFYNNLGKKLYGQPLGKVINQTRIDLLSSNSNTYLKNTAQEFTLHGDPAIVLNSHAKPDLTIKNTGIKISPDIITTEIDSFYVKIIPLNISKTTSKSFTVGVSRTYSNGSKDSYNLLLDGLSYRDTLTIKMPVDRIKGTGINSITIDVDVFNQVDELNELNNSATLNFYISSTDIVGVFPYNYSLNPTQNITFKASTGNPFVGEQTYTFQVDTTYLFNSPFLFSENITHGGGVLQWNPAIAIEPFQAYFWRVAKSKPTNSSTIWSNNSFTFEQDKTGWQQNNYGQYRDNDMKFVEPNEQTKQIDFITAPKKLRCHNIGLSASSFSNSNIGYSIDGIGDYGSCKVPSMIVVVIDSLTLKPWESDRDNFNQHNYPGCRSNRSDYYYVFGVDNTSISNLVNFINNDVPTGNYFLIYSFARGNFETWSDPNVLAFESWGATQIRFAEDTYPYIFYSRKGDASVSVETIGNSSSDVLDFNINIKGDFTYGYMDSPFIGPAKSWSTFSWENHKLEVNPDEVGYVKIFGADYANNETLLFDSVIVNTVDLSAISAVKYPFIHLSFYTRDNDFKTPMQIDYWKVVYESVSDLAINPSRAWEFCADTLNEGETGSITIAYENIGTSAFDSVLVKYWIQDAQNNNHILSSRRLKPLASGEFVIDTLSFNSLGKPNTNKFWIEANPLNDARIYEQKEQYHFNNIAQKSFFVKADATNPILDVTFNGIHIMDGDIISSKPEIDILLNDENKFIALVDTSLISVYIKSQKTGVEQKIELVSNPDVQFIPAEMPKNKAYIKYNTHFDEDGIYELRVQAKDASGNGAGALDYNVSFQIINESTITNVFNYPNPFSTSTRFVFELTGSDIPDEMRIDILTVTGKIVKVIYLEDLGLLSIGKNITQYAWDGRDMYGDRLANGVYFYRVYARINGQQIKHRDSGTSQYFKNGFGKMYLMR